MTLRLESLTVPSIFGFIQYKSRFVVCAHFFYFQFALISESNFGGCIMKSTLKLFVGVFFSLCLFSISMMAQATTGTLRGVVVDSGGSVVAGANVTVKNEGTGVDTVSVTNNEGRFDVVALSPGSYTVTTEAPSFKRSVRSGVQVKVGIVNPIDIELEVGNVSETVTVTSSTEETLQTEQSQITGTIDTRRVQDLPSNGAGGGIDTLALLIPGVIANRVGGTNTNGTGLSVNGNRGRSNNFQIDGADNNDLSVGGPALFVDFQDSIQEFQIVTNNFDARYGRNQGAVVNIVTKGGTNDFHGSAYFNYQDAKALNSLTNIERRSGITENDTNLYKVFGGTVGGPVYLPGFGEGVPAVWSGKNRAFFFFSYQGIRNPSTFTSRSTSLGILPTEFSRLQSTFPGAVSNTIATFSPWAIPGARLNATSVGTPINTQFNLSAPAGCPRAIAVGATPTAGCGTYTTFINPATGQPFQTGGAYDTLNLGTAAAPQLFQAAQYERSLPTASNEDYYSIRFDVKPTNKDSVTFRYLNQESISQNGLGTISSGFTGDIPVGSTNYGGNWSRSFTSSILNDFKLNYQKIGVEFGGGCEASTPGCIPGPANIDVAFANIAFPVALGITKTNAMPTIGPATNLPQGRIGKVYQVADNLSWLIGKHAFTFGAEYKHLDTLVPFLPNFNGAFSFNTAERIRNNAPSGVSITLGDPLLSFVEKDQYYFIQDDFKIRPNLTLNLGIRYEYTGQPINILNEVSTVRESNASTALFNPALPLNIRTVPSIPADKNNFAPRFGFAYTPKFWKWLFGEDATVFRGGYSIAYDAAFYNILLNVQNGAPFSVALAIPTTSLPTSGSQAPLPNNPFGNVVRAAAAASGVLPTGVLNPIYLAQVKVGDDFRAPYSQQFSFGMQRQIGRKNIAEVRYVGTRGIGLFQNINDNFFIAPLVNGFTRSGITFPSFANLLPAGTVSQVCLNNPATLDNEAACNGRQYRQAGITTRKNTGNSNYHSLQSRFNGRFWDDSISLGASYTFSKTIDDASEIFAFGDIASPNAQNPFCINSCERSLSNLDRPHAFSANFVFDVPFYKDQRGFVGRLLGGWQINGTYILTSGAAYTPSNNVAGSLGLGGTYLTAGDRPFYGNPNADARLVGISQIDANLVFGVPCSPAPCSNTTTGFYSMNELNTTGNAVAVTPNDVRFIINGPGSAKIFGTPYGNVPRNSLRGPKFNNVNLSLFKNIRIFESLKVQLRAEAFNAFNNPNPGFGVASGGTLPSINLTNAGLPGTAFGTFEDIEYADRVFQVGLRIVF
jgi:outer membrane receptor protein involved in Fe transport